MDSLLAKMDKKKKEKKKKSKKKPETDTTGAATAAASISATTPKTTTKSTPKTTPKDKPDTPLPANSTASTTPKSQPTTPQPPTSTPAHPTPPSRPESSAGQPPPPKPPKAKAIVKKSDHAWLRWQHGSLIPRWDLDLRGGAQWEFESYDHFTGLASTGPPSALGRAFARDRVVTCQIGVRIARVAGWMEPGTGRGGEGARGREDVKKYRHVVHELTIFLAALFGEDGENVVLCRMEEEDEDCPGGQHSFADVDKAVAYALWAVPHLLRHCTRRHADKLDQIFRVLLPEERKNAVWALVSTVKTVLELGERLPLITSWHSGSLMGAWLTVLPQKQTQAR